MRIGFKPAGGIRTAKDAIGFQIHTPKTLDPQPSTRNPKTLNPTPKTRKPKAETLNPQPCILNVKA